MMAAFSVCAMLRRLLREPAAMPIVISKASRTRVRPLRFKTWLEGLREKIEMDLNTSTGYYEVERPAREIRERRCEPGFEI